MANPKEQVPLPDSVEQLLDRICSEQNQTPPDSDLRHQLAALGEESASHILSIIASHTIRYSLSRYIKYMMHKVPSTAATSPNKAICVSSNATPGSTARRINPQVGNNIIRSMVAEYPGSTSPEEMSAKPVLTALGELEFRKSFLLLSYIGGESLERAITADKIRSLKELPMGTFEDELVDWDSGKPFVYHCHVSTNGSFRFKQKNGAVTYKSNCHDVLNKYGIVMVLMIESAGPFSQETRTHLQKSLGDDNVLIVKFSEERNGSQRTSVHDAYKLYKRFRQEGIRVGLRLYRFFVFKDGGKEEKRKDPTTSPVKCYFVRMESCAAVDENKPYILTNKTVSDARSLFMHAHTLDSLDKFMARFSLILSKTLKLDIDLASVNVEKIEDVCCQDENGKTVIDKKKGKPRIHTDGTGFISEDLAVVCPSNVAEGRPMNNRSSKGIPDIVECADTTMAIGKLESGACEPPLLIQCRLFHMGRAIKGILLINKELPSQTIQVRPSMIKVDADQSLPMQCINSLEIVATSNKPRRTYLSGNLIALLSYGGVPNEFFMDLLRSALDDAHGVFTNKRAALRVSINHGEMDEFIETRMILSGIPLDEPYLQHRLSAFSKDELKGLRKGKLPVPDSYYLMGTADPTGRLERGQVCIIHENGQISGDVLVYRNPGLHFGDIHILQATYVKELESFVGHSRYAIFFPSVGPRSLGDEIAGGDFDGDLYWVSKNTQLLKLFRKSDPWIERTSSSNDVNGGKQPSALSAEELEDELFKRYLKNRFQPSYTVGVAAESWKALMDRMLTLRDDCPKEMEEKERVKENILKLIDIYYEALDAPKSGGKKKPLVRSRKQAGVHSGFMHLQQQSIPTGVEERKTIVSLFLRNRDRRRGRKIEVPKELKAEIYPHYMEKENSYTSTSILGLIYDEVETYQSEETTYKDIVKLPCFEVEIPERCMNMWRVHYDEYRREMTSALYGDPKDKSKAAEEVIKKYREILYGAPELEYSSKCTEDIYNEALALYHVVYDFAKKNNSINKCNFAWRVAGSALLNLYASQQGERAFICVPSVLREIFG
ncbi:putative RNA-dependent RNA polymerase 5 [Senna tora]|uniref:RNA-dependent RNA polymerase n=1 Tax=Senna tora TaxID=362788 RepID=A0A834W855_9FABA|nr:putative RNA-dependent RNA polymerase 5 [Senna tora]